MGLRKKSSEAENYFHSTGVTFDAYGNEDAAERLIPFDRAPRILSSSVPDMS